LGRSGRGRNSHLIHVNGVKHNSVRASEGKGRIVAAQSKKSKPITFPLVVRPSTRGNEKLRLGQAGAVVQIEFGEWTPDGHLRHSKFVGLREDKEPSEVLPER